MEDDELVDDDTDLEDEFVAGLKKKKENLKNYVYSGIPLRAIFCKNRIDPK